MSKKLFRGIMPAAITPFDADGELKQTVAYKLLTDELASGVNGFYVNGATGEGLFLSEKTRMAMAETAVDVCKGNAAVINHVGAVDTQSAIRLARHAGMIGCSAVSSLVPNYIAQYTTPMILDYYKRIADESSLPVLVYCTGLVGNDPYSFMREVMRIDGVIGCKFTMTNYYDMHRITEMNGGDINVINGPDEMLVLGLMMGADGGIGSTYNIMPERYLALYKAFAAGDYEKARQIQFGINRIIEILLAHGCIPAIKKVLEMRGYDVGNAAYPGKVISPEESDDLKNELEDNGLVI